VASTGDNGSGVRAPKYFASAVVFRRWLAAHHEGVAELVVGFHKKSSGRPGMTWPEAVDEALCVGWIDGVRRRVDDDRYTIRFTPRRARSVWSTVNIARVAELLRLERMQPAGMRVFERRLGARSSIYSYEQRDVGLDAEREGRFRGHKAAWAFFEAQAPSYRRIAIWWVVSAKRVETRERRLVTLIDDCARGRLIKSQRRA
jgi:uncharacterized protein YdeI (YjbR/CyaY-like superfamily)